MSGRTKWRDAVRVVRGATIEQAMAAADGRATAFDFSGTGSKP